MEQNYELNEKCEELIKYDDTNTSKAIVCNAIIMLWTGIALIIANYILYALKIVTSLKEGFAFRRIYHNCILYANLYI